MNPEQGFGIVFGERRKGMTVNVHNKWHCFYHEPCHSGSLGPASHVDEARLSGSFAQSNRDDTYDSQRVKSLLLLLLPISS